MNLYNPFNVNVSSQNCILDLDLKEQERVRTTCQVFTAILSLVNRDFLTCLALTTFYQIGSEDKSSTATQDETETHFSSVGESQNINQIVICLYP